MAVNRKCPKCGNDRVQLSNVRSNHGLIKFIFFGIFYLAFICVKWVIGATIFFVWDWWRYLIAKSSDKGYVWQSLRWFALNKKNYYCHECGYNFKA